MIDRTYAGFQCHTRYLLRTVKGNLPWGSHGTVACEMDNVGRHLILMNWDKDFSVPVFPMRSSLRTRPVRSRTDHSPSQPRSSTAAAKREASLLMAVTMVSRVSFFLLFTLALVSAASAQAPLTVEWKEGRLSVSTEGTPLSQILREIARQTGMEIRGLEGLQEPVFVQFTDLPLHEGLQQLSVNSLIVWETFPWRKAKPVRALVFRRRTPLPREALPREAMPSEGGPKPQDEPGAEEEQEDRLEALHTFAQQGDEAALQKAIFDPDPTIQKTAFALLAERDRQRATDALVDATKSDEPEVRLQALHLLHQADQVDEGIVRAALGAALADADPTVKEAAIQALADRGGADAVGYLRQAFHDPDPAIRILVLEHAADQDQGLSLLQEALADEDEIVRSVAFSRLQQAIAERR